jgi:DNA mismatch endonuclease, patch repair protein
VKQRTSTSTGAHLKEHRKTNTEPELLLRRALHRLGARFRLHRRIASGCIPDLVLSTQGIAVFADGDFVGMDVLHTGALVLRAERRTLGNKLRRHRERDDVSTKWAAEAGGSFIRVWECSSARSRQWLLRQYFGRAPGPVLRRL